MADIIVASSCAEAYNESTRIGSSIEEYKGYIQFTIFDEIISLITMTVYE